MVLEGILDILCVLCSQDILDIVRVSYSQYILVIPCASS
jgi:hypothetical protein